MYTDWQQESRDLTLRIGKRIHALRVAAGMSLADIGQSDISRAHLSNIERGINRPSLIALLIVARRLGVDLVDLIRED